MQARGSAGPTATIDICQISTLNGSRSWLASKRRAPGVRARGNAGPTAVPAGRAEHAAAGYCTPDRGAVAVHRPSPRSRPYCCLRDEWAVGSKGWVQWPSTVHHHDLDLAAACMREWGGSGDGRQQGAGSVQNNMPRRSQRQSCM